MNSLISRCWPILAALCIASSAHAQGGETCATATAIGTLPYCDAGTTVGFANDYTPPCLTGVAAPDVVYTYTPPATQIISVSLCFSGYNTLLHVYRGCPSAGGQLICCSDNFCSLQSCCPNLTVLTGAVYYFIVDGSNVGGGALAGAYTINVVAGTQCPTAPCDPDVCPYPDLDVDPTNDVCTGNTPVLACNDTVCGVISPTTDQDWYAIDIPQPDCVILTLNVYADDSPGWWPFGQGLNPRVWLVGIDCATVLGMDDDGGDGADSRLVSACIQPGRYKILVENSSSTQPAGPYILRTSCQLCDCPSDSCEYANRDIEPGNNVCATSNPQLLCGDTLCGEVEPNTSGDYYLLSVPSPGCYRVKLDVFGNDTPGWWPEGQGLDPIVSVYDDACTFFYGSDDNSGVGNDAHLELCLPGGRYHVFVHDPSGLTGGPYILAAFCEPCECPQDTCPYPSRDNEAVNDSCATFNPQLACSDTLCGEIQPQADRDWYLLQVPQPCAEVTIDVFGHDTPGWWPFGQGLNPRVTLVSLDCGSVLDFDLNSGVGEDPRLVTACLPGGLYHVVIEGEGAAAPSVGPYIVAVHCTPCNCTPCDIVCQQGDIAEGEPCPNFPDLVNSGCDNPIGTGIPIRPIPCGGTICGHLWSDSTYYDRDWYLLSTQESDTLMWCVWSEVPIRTYIIAPGPGQNPCIDSDTLACGRSTGPCDTVCIGACVPPGSYAFKIEPLIGGIPYPTIPCSTTYRARLLCTICSPPVVESPDSVVIYYPTYGYTGIDLHWPPVPGAEAYHIYRNPDFNAIPTPATYIATTADTFFVDTGIIATAAERNIYVIRATVRVNGCR